MLRITAEETATGTRLLLEGKLKGAWVAELEAVYLRRKASNEGSRLVLDIDNVTATDQAGRYLLALLESEGAELAWSGARPAHLLGNAALTSTDQRLEN